MKILPSAFKGQAIRRLYDEATETWWFSVIDIVQVLTDSSSAKRYWSDLKRKLAQEVGSAQPYEEIVRFKLPSTDGKKRETDCATAESLLRIVQSIPSPKAEPIKRWLAKVGYERMQEIADPAQARPQHLKNHNSQRSLHPPLCMHTSFLIARYADWAPVFTPSPSGGGWGWGPTALASSASVPNASGPPSQPSPRGGRGKIPQRAQVAEHRRRRTVSPPYFFFAFTHVCRTSRHCPPPAHFWPRARGVLPPIDHCPGPAAGAARLGA